MFVEAAREHGGAQWKFRAAIPARVIATSRSTASDARTLASPSARDKTANWFVQGQTKGHRMDVWKTSRFPDSTFVRHGQKATAQSARSSRPLRPQGSSIRLWNS
jgi:hypothetical protein